MEASDIPLLLQLETVEVQPPALCSLFEVGLALQHQGSCEIACASEIANAVFKVALDLVHWMLNP